MVSIKELARMADTSISSVSRVLNKLPGVNPEVRRRVEDLIKAYDFHPNPLAKALHQKRSRVIGIVLPTIDTYYAARVSGLLDVCLEHDFGSMIATSREHADEELDNFRLLDVKQVDGIVFFAAKVSPLHADVIGALHERRPVVVIGQPIPGLSVQVIDPDHYAGARTLMEHLTGLGHRDIAHLSGPPDNYSAERRIAAWRDVLAEHRGSRQKDKLLTGDFTLEGGYRAVQAFLSQSGSRLPTALFCSNDMMAIGALRALHEAGIRVPEDISVAGFDDTPVAAYACPSLTTVRQDHYEVGRQAGLVMLDLLHRRQTLPRDDYEPALLHSIAQELIVRDSTARPRV